ncbi:MCR_0457 family protein, partial [Acinetobacter ursingii]
MRTSFISRFCLFTLTAITLSQMAFANEALSQAERNALVKEDIAGTQVLSEVCPTLIGKNATFEQNIQKLIQTNLKAYSGQNMTFAA